MKSSLDAYPAVAMTMPDKKYVVGNTSEFFKREPYYLSQYNGFARELGLDVTTYEQCLIFKQFILEIFYLVVAFDSAYLNDFLKRHQKNQITPRELFQLASSQHGLVCLPCPADYAKFAMNITQHEQLHELLHRHGLPLPPRIVQVVRRIVTTMADDLHQFPFFMVYNGSNYVTSLNVTAAASAAAAAARAQPY